MRSERGRGAARWATAALVVALAGCGGPEPAPAPGAGGGNDATLPLEDRGGRDPTETEPVIEAEFQVEWDEIERNDRGVRDPEEVARWVAERRSFVERCLNNDPQAVGQARRTLEEILKRVPDSSKDRFLLGQCQFSEASYWWRVTDVTAWELNRVTVDRTAHLSEGGRKLTEAEVQERVGKLRQVLDRNMQKLNESGQRALSTFIAYRQLRPDDKRVFDYLWKLYFFLQDYAEARRWLQLVLFELDQAGVPAQDPLRQDYQALAEEIAQKLADARTTGQGFQPVRPLSRDRLSPRGGGVRSP